MFRSIAAGRARRSAEAEAAFTLEMITANFSNYSAWHRRSKLLGQAGPGHAEELDLVQNAAFTVRRSLNLDKFCSSLRIFYLDRHIC